MCLISHILAVFDSVHNPKRNNFFHSNELYVQIKMKKSVTNEKKKEA